LTRRTLYDTRRSAALLGPGDQGSPDTPGGVSAGLRQTECLIGSILRLLGLDLAVPDHSTLSRRAEALEIPKPCPGSSGSVHLLVDSTGLQLFGLGERLVEKHGAGDAAPGESCTFALMPRPDRSSPQS